MASPPGKSGRLCWTPRSRLQTSNVIDAPVPPASDETTSTIVPCGAAGRCPRMRSSSAKSWFASPEFSCWAVSRSPSKISLVRASVGEPANCTVLTRTQDDRRGDLAGIRPPPHQLTELVHRWLRQRLFQSGVQLLVSVVRRGDREVPSALLADCRRQPVADPVRLGRHVHVHELPAPRQLVPRPPPHPQLRGQLIHQELQGLSTRTAQADRIDLVHYDISLSARHA